MPNHCINEGCKKYAIFGKKDTKLSEYCATHKPKDYVDVKHKKCLKCDKRPAFGKPGSKLAEYCVEHKPEDYIDIVSKRCLKCDKIPIYGKLGSKLAEYCVEHKPEDYINVKNKKCLSCDKQPIYGKPGSKLAEYCAEHKPEDYIDIKSKKCLSCDKIPIYGKPGSKIAEYCINHKPEDYIDVKNKRCLLCDKRPNFGKPGSKISDYCISHKPEDYIDIKSKKCLKCDKQPAYGKPGSKISEYCVNHKPEAYIDIKSKKCLLCCKIPNYGKPGSKIAEYCATHKPEAYIDVKHKICLKCQTRASYGPLFQPKRHCAKHKTNNEFSKNNPKCREGCKELPIYTVKGDNYPNRCEDHKLEDDINIVERECQSCKLKWIIPDDQTMCNACREFNTPSIRNRKENKIKALLEANNITYESHDKYVDVNCSRKRPDFILDYNFYKVVIEIDENQHRSYPCECEQSRMIQIHQDIGMDTLFIRFNPDSYINNERKRIKSYTSRESKLLDLLNSLKNTEKRETSLEVIYMYYDNWGGNIEIESINYI